MLLVWDSIKRHCKGVIIEVGIVLDILAKPQDHGLLGLGIHVACEGGYFATESLIVICKKD